MCHAVPAEVIELLDGERARVRLGQATQIVSTALVEEVVPGDYLIVHVGYGLSRLDRGEAEATLKLIEQMGRP